MSLLPLQSLRVPRLSLAPRVLVQRLLVQRVVQPKSVRRSTFAKRACSATSLLGFVVAAALSTSGCIKECITDLDCERTTEGLEQVCSDSVCVEIDPQDVEACGLNNQCPDGEIGGSGICWDGVCRFRPPCLFFDGPMSVALDCGPGDVSIINGMSVSRNLGGCISDLEINGTFVPVEVDSIAEYSAEGSDARALPIAASVMCEAGQYYADLSLGFIPTCTSVGSCAVSFRAATAGGFCLLNGGSCDDGKTCLPINRELSGNIADNIGACQ